MGCCPRNPPAQHRYAGDLGGRRSQELQPRTIKVCFQTPNFAVEWQVLKWRQSARHRAEVNRRAPVLLAQMTYILILKLDAVNVYNLQKKRSTDESIQTIVHPPSITTAWPVMKDEASDAR